METKLIFKYDRKGDILYINKRAPYPEQESEEVGDDIIARINPETGEVENIEVLFFSTRLLRDDLMMRYGMSEYIAKYEKQFTRNLKKHR